MTHIILHKLCYVQVYFDAQSICTLGTLFIFYPLEGTCHVLASHTLASGDVQTDRECELKGHLRAKVLFN